MPFERHKEILVDDYPQDIGNFEFMMIPFDDEKGMEKWDGLPEVTGKSPAHYQR